MNSWYNYYFILNTILIIHLNFTACSVILNLTCPNNYK